jgi:putative FmdB family regulatory protein
VPTYEYRCTKGHTFDVIQGFNDAPVERCEVCGSPVERVLHSPAVHFKGSGFYNTDYGTKKRQREKAADTASSDAASKTKAADTATESKPASDKAAPEKAKVEKAASKSTD